MTKFFTKDKKVHPITPKRAHIGTMQKGTAHLTIPKMKGKLQRYEIKLKKINQQQWDAYTSGASDSERNKLKQQEIQLRDKIQKLHNKQISKMEKRDLNKGGKPFVAIFTEGGSKRTAVEFRASNIKAAKKLAGQMTRPDKRLVSVAQKEVIQGKRLFEKERKHVRRQPKFLYEVTHTNLAGNIDSIMVRAVNKSDAKSQVRNAIDAEKRLG